MKKLLWPGMLTLLLFVLTIYWGLSTGTLANIMLFVAAFGLVCASISLGIEIREGK